MTTEDGMLVFDLANAILKVERAISHDEAKGILRVMANLAWVLANKINEEAGESTLPSKAQR